MMNVLKRLLILIFGVIAIGMQAQELKVLEFRADMTMTDAVRFPKEDLNGNRGGLIRMGLVIPDATFEGDIISSEYKDGEWWIYMVKESNWITIKSKTHVPLRYEFEPIQSNVTYVMTVVEVTGAGGKPKPTHQYLAFQINPANAILEVNGQLWEVGSDGSAMKFVSFGTYNYRVQAPNYHPETGTVKVKDPENTQKVKINLKPDFVEVTLKVDTEAEIWVNDEKKGVGTWKGNLGKGAYKIECKQDGHETSTTTQEITADLNGQTIILTAPIPIYGSLNIESTPSFATVYIDGKTFGETPKFIHEILVGQHKVRLAKKGHKDYTETVTIKKGESTQVKANMQPERIASGNNRPDGKMIFMLANIAYSVAPQTSFGLTFGSVNQFGWYVSMASNFRFKGTHYTCDGSGKIEETYGDGYTDYTYSDRSYTSRLSATAGLVARVANPISLYFGGGFGFRNLYWVLEDGTWVKNTDYSHSGFSIDGGLLFHYGNFSLSAGVQTIGFNYLEAKVGIGFSIKSY